MPTSRWLKPLRYDWIAQWSTALEEVADPVRKFYGYFHLVLLASSSGAASLVESASQALCDVNAESRINFVLPFIRLLPYLNQADQHAATRLLKKLLRAKAIGESTTELAKHLPTAQMEKVMRYVTRYSSTDEVNDFIAGLTERWQQESEDDCRQVLSQLVGGLSNRRRAEVYGALSLVWKHVGHIVGPEGVRQMAQSVLDVSEWWG